MKKLILIIFLSPLFAHSQIDSTEIKIAQLKSGIIYMRDNLKKCHSEFSTGMSISFAGMFVGIASVAITTDKEKDLRDILLIAGGGLTIIGSVIMWDSHKYIGRAGNFRFSSNSISLAF